MRRTMRRTKNLSTRQNMEINAWGHNKYLTKKYRKRLNLIGLLRNIHPMDRGDFARKLFKEGKISEAASNEFIQLK